MNERNNDPENGKNTNQIIEVEVAKSFIMDWFNKRIDRFSTKESIKISNSLIDSLKPKNK
jgi:hypothetical protein